MSSKTWDELLRSCVASPCIKDRVAESAFCDEHHKKHAKSPYPAHLRALMDVYEKGKKR